MALTVGKVDFKKDPFTGEITYSDQYDYSGKLPFLGPSKGQPYEFTNPKNK